MSRTTLLILHIISLVLLGFGWLVPMLHIEISVQKAFIIDINMNLFDEQQSVLSTLESLWNSDNYWAFFLIFLFGILIPLVKSAAIFYLLLAKKPRRGWYSFITAISKWAMADVFVMSIFVAFLGANALESTKATLEPGFYYFAAYVLLSGIIAMLLGKMMKKTAILKV